MGDTYRPIKRCAKAADHFPIDACFLRLDRARFMAGDEE